MNRFKGTPAPWVVVDNGYFFHFESTSDRKRIGDTYAPTHFFDESIHNTNSVAYANACLIASAPELLDALIEMQRNGRKQGWNDKYESSMEKTRLAIAKALGEVK